MKYSGEGDRVMDAATKLLNIGEVAERLRVKVVTVRWLDMRVASLRRSRLGVGWCGTSATSRRGSRNTEKVRPDERPAVCHR